MVNLYALRSTDPRGLWVSPDPVGPLNDAHLLQAAQESSRVVAGWGAHARAPRVAEVGRLLGGVGLEHLGLTLGGAPKHPLYLRGDTVPAPLVVPTFRRPEATSLA